jgi:hypothetical protein
MLADVATVKVVSAVPLDGVTVRGVNVHVMPLTGAQDKETSPANPPTGVTVNMNCVECPAVTVAVEGFAPKEKSALAMLRVTPAEVLPSNFPSER